MRPLIILTLLLTANTVPVVPYSVGPVFAQSKQDRDEDRRRLDQDEQRENRARRSGSRQKAQQLERSDCQLLQSDGGSDSFCCNRFGLACRGARN